MAENNGNGKQINVLELVTSRKIKKIIALAIFGLQILFAVLFIFVGLKETLHDSAAVYNVFDPDYNATVTEIVFTSIVTVMFLGIIVTSAIGIFYSLARIKSLKLQITAASFAFATLIFSILAVTIPTV